MKKYSLSLIDFAIPSPRMGSIDTYSGFGSISKRAIQRHQEIQASQSKENPNYQSEVSITHKFLHKKMAFQVSGRMDGIYLGEELKIQEIKTGFDLNKLAEALTDTQYTHPYWLQLQTYGYMHWLKTNKVPELELFLASVRNKKNLILTLEFNIDAYEKWLEIRMDELHSDILAATKRIKKRKNTGLKLNFPFHEPRAQQKELIETVFTQMAKNKPMLIQAPTGLGKTMGILYPSLKESLGRGQKTIYLTPKNSQHQIALDAIHKLQEKGAPAKSLVLTSKKKLCMKNEPICNARYCEFAENHYTKVSEHHLLQKIQKQKNTSAWDFKKIAKSYQVCPYELQMQSIPQMDIVVGDYNYVFAQSTNSSRVVTLPLGENEKPNLIIDEVHNLPSRSMEYYSPALFASLFENLLLALDKYPHPFQVKLSAILTKCISIIDQCAQAGNSLPHLIEPPQKEFKQQDEILNEFLTHYLESDLEIEPEDPILQLCNYWTDFTEAIDIVKQGDGAFFTMFNPKEHSIKITCCDASKLLEINYQNFQQIIGFSATLKPFNYYSQLIGLNIPNLHTQEFLSPFPADLRKLLIIPQISSKYRDRNRHFGRLIEAVTRIVTIKKGNYFIFFPSFDYLEKIFKLFPTLDDFIYLRQTRKMQHTEVNDLLTKLHRKEYNHLFFAVQGGMFAEGLDYPGELAIGAFVVGPPLPMYDGEREQMKRYYDLTYQAGNEYTYIYPAMAKAIQSAGRVIRTDTDKGIIILVDDRFLLPDYSKCMPLGWFEDSPYEMVSGAIIKDLTAFWDKLTVSTT